MNTLNSKISSCKKIQILKGENETIVLEESILSLEVTLTEKAHVTIYDIQIEPQNTERNITINLEGENSTAEIYGLCILSGNTKSKSNITVNHNVENCKSTQVYRAILDDKSRSDFEGKIYVAKHADGTLAHQESKNLLLSDAATVSAIPSLEIYAEDVKCSHGATSGQLDPEALFYMQARGIDTEKAKELLTFAFAKEIIDKVKSQELRETLEKNVKRKLERSCLHIYS